MIPPLITVGSRPPPSSNAATMEVVVVLPWVPATATVFCMRMSSASISARRTRGRRRSAAATISRLPSLIAREQTASAEIVGRMADADRNAGLAQLFDDVALSNVRALNLIAELVHHLGNSGHT